MNDRFKFRYFNKEANKMVEATNWQNIDGIYECLKQQICFDENIPPLPYDHIGNGLVFMQCTGLKDKNGKLIYEGDIVKKEVFIDYNGNGYQPDVYTDRTYIGVVHFTASNGATLQKVKIYETESPHEEKKQRDKRDCPKASKLVACRSEVIGNIYENADLLEE